MRIGNRQLNSLLAVLLSVSLFVSLQPCCELFVALFTPNGVTSSVATDDGGDALGSTVPGKARDTCDQGASSRADLAKAVPAIAAKTAASPTGAVLVAAASWEFTAVPRSLSVPAFHPSPPPLPVYLRFLHLLM